MTDSKKTEPTINQFDILKCCFTGDESNEHIKNCVVCAKRKKQLEDDQIPKEDITNIYNQM